MFTDKSHGTEFLRQFESSCSKLEELVGAVNKEMKDRAALVEILEQSELFYDAQHGEAKIVANVCSTCRFSYRLFSSLLLSFLLSPPPLPLSVPPSRSLPLPPLVCV